MSNKRAKILIIGLIVSCLLSGCGNKKNYETEIDVSVINEEQETVDIISQTDIVMVDESDSGNVSTELSDEDIKANCTKLIEDIQYWEYECLYWYYDDVNEKHIDFLTDEEDKAKLSTMTTPVEYDVEGEGVEITLSESEVQTNAQKIFGSEIDIDALPEEDIFAKKVAADGKIKPVVYYSFIEDEGLYNVLSQEVVETGDGFDVLQHLYCGYWGYFNEENGNYDVKFHLKKDPNSFYGVVLTDMSFNQAEMPALESNNTKTPFYGIWCCGVKDEETANKVAEDLGEKGSIAYVLVTSDWSNLNSDRWYAVTAGMYSTEEEAKNMLGEVQSLGYGDAYVKYSGDYRGN